MLLGISGVRADGALSPGFATYRGRFFSGRHEREPHDSGMLASFLPSSGDVGDGVLESFLVVLNEETDAPPSVIAGLEPVRVERDIPPGWLEAGDAVICLRIELGSMGCTASDAGDGEPVIMSEAWIEPGRGVDIQVARADGGDPSWTERVTIATVPAELFVESHEVRVRLSTTTIPEHHDDVVRNQDEELVVGMTPA